MHSLSRLTEKLIAWNRDMLGCIFERNKRVMNKSAFARGAIVEAKITSGMAQTLRLQYKILSLKHIGAEEKKHN